MTAKNHPNKPSSKELKLAKLANLPENVTLIRIIQHSDCDELFVLIPDNEIRICPSCGSSNCILKDNGISVSLRHTVSSQRRGSFVTMHKKRFLCKDCQSSFYQQIDWIIQPLRMTTSLYLQISLDLTKMLSIKTIATMNQATPANVSSVLKSISFDLPTCLPETLCIDEFKGSSGDWDPEKGHWDVNKYHCNICNDDLGYIVDILPCIRASYIKAYFLQFSPRQREQVKYFCCDMHNGFLSVARDVFPHAHICIDLFHVVKLLNEAVDGIRKRLQRDMQEIENKELYSKLRRAMRSLLVNEINPGFQKSINRDKRLKQLQELFELFPELEIAHTALQEFHCINNLNLIQLQRVELSEWLAKYTSCEIPELRHAANSIRRWRRYLENTWEFKRSNSTCEGLNNKVKTLKRVSFGLHSFEAFRKRVLLTCGSIRLADNPVTIFSQKREGTGIRL